MTLIKYIFFTAAIDSTDNCRKDKSLGVLSQKFLIMFLLSKVMNFANTVAFMLSTIFYHSRKQLRACSYGQKLSLFPRKVSTGQIVLFCSYGELFSHLPGKISRCDVDFVKCAQKVFSPCVHMQVRSRYPGKRFVSYERNATFYIIS